MKLSCVAALAILLTASGSKGHGNEVNSRGEPEDDIYDFETSPFLQKLKNKAMHLVNGERPDEEANPASYADSSVDLADLEQYVGNVRYELYEPKYLISEQSSDEISDNEIQKPSENLPSILGVGFGSELKDALELTYGGSDTEDGGEASDKNISDSSLDEIVDFLIEMVSREIVAKGKDQIPVPNMSEEFEKKIGFVDVHGKFDAEQGWFKNLSTMQRTGDVVAERRGLATLLITSEMGLSTMQFGFDSYQANIAGISVSGKMTGSVANNSVTIQVGVSFEGYQCNITLERLTVDRFDGLTVQLTGLGDLSWLLDNIVQWATQHFKNDIVSSIEDNLRKVITGIISNYHCSELMDLLKNLPQRTFQDVSVVIV